MTLGPSFDHNTMLSPLPQAISQLHPEELFADSNYLQNSVQNYTSELPGVVETKDDAKLDRDDAHPQMDLSGEVITTSAPWHPIVQSRNIDIIETPTHQCSAVGTASATWQTVATCGKRRFAVRKNNVTINDHVTRAYLLYWGIMGTTYDVGTEF